MIASQTSTVITNNTIDIEITNEFNSSKIENTSITIDSETIFGPSLSQFTKGVEWVSVLTKLDNFYIIAGCAPMLTIENGNIIGETGLTALDSSVNQVSIELFSVALNVFQQGLSLADSVCQSSNSYCVKRTTYDTTTGILGLPSVEYQQFGIPVYAKVKMQKTGDNPMIFTVIELK